MQLFAIDRVGSARLDSPFLCAGECALRRVQHPREGGRRNCRGRSAADIARAQLKSLFAHHFAAFDDFMLQRSDIRLDQLTIPNFAGRERAIRAARGAERNADIEIEFILFRMENARLHIRDLAEQLRTIGRNVERLAEPSPRLLGIQPRIQSLVQKPRRAYAGERAPREIHTRHFLQKAIEPVLDAAFARALDFNRVSGTDGRFGSAAMVFARPIVDPDAVFLARRMCKRLFRRVRYEIHVAVKQAQHVAQIVFKFGRCGDQANFHSRYLLRSARMVVSPP